MKKPKIMLKIAVAGVASGLPLKATTVDQSIPKEPTPRPFNPDPICCMVIDLLKIKHKTEMVEIAGKMKPGMV